MYQDRKNLFNRGKISREKRTIYTSLFEIVVFANCYSFFPPSSLVSHRKDTVVPIESTIRNEQNENYIRMNMIIDRKIIRSTNKYVISQRFRDILSCVRLQRVGEVSYNQRIQVPVKSFLCIYIYIYYMHYFFFHLSIIYNVTRTYIHNITSFFLGSITLRLLLN